MRKPENQTTRLLRVRPVAAVLTVAAMVATLVSGFGHAEAGVDPDRNPTPEDRYAMAGGCYAIQHVASGDVVVRTEDGFALADADPEPFHFQATDLGRYLLYGTASDFLAASEGTVGEVATAVTDSTPGGYASGLTIGTTDDAGEQAKQSPANEATGRGATVVAASEPSELADFEIDGTPGAFTLTLPAIEKALVASDGELVLAEDPEAFAFELTSGCAEFPELEVNIDGPVVGGGSPFAEVRGFFDAHNHMMAYEFIGGRVRCGRPWHRYGVAYALVDCPDHEPGGHGAALEMALSGGDPVNGHNTDGWPTFEGWPRNDSLTHEQIYYRWLERAWRGGLRLMTNLLVDNAALCKSWPYKENSCNEMDGVRLQAQRIHELERYIDAQSGGPGEGWFRIVTDPFEARRVMNDGKLAVILGIEVSTPLDCGLRADIPQCTAEDIDEELDAVYELGVRQMEMANKFDNALTGVTGDAGGTGVVVNTGNFQETGLWWKFDTCETDEHGHDKQQLNFHDESGAPDEFSGRDSIFGAVLALAGTSGAAPVYSEGPHCNVRGLTELGEHMVRGMMERGMIFDPDHMSAVARHEALDLIENAGYSGVVSSHSWSDDTVYPRVYELGGVVTPYAGDADDFVAKWRRHKAWHAEDGLDPYFGFGYGSDVNGFGSQGDPRGGPEKVSYPFTGFGGTTIHRQVSGTRAPYDINTDGVAHYGLYPDWIEDLRVQAGDEIVEDMVRGPEAYLQMWERAIGITPNACRNDVSDITDAQVDALTEGMTPEDVLLALGQPNVRYGVEFWYCATGDRTAFVMFSQDGELVHAEIT